MMASPPSPLERERLTYAPVVPACLAGDKILLAYYEPLQQSRSGEDVCDVPRVAAKGVRRARVTSEGSSLTALDRDARGGRRVDLSEFFPITHALPT